MSLSIWRVEAKLLIGNDPFKRSGEDVKCAAIIQPEFSVPYWNHQRCDKGRERIKAVDVIVVGILVFVIRVRGVFSLSLEQL